MGLDIRQRINEQHSNYPFTDGCMLHDMLRREDFNVVRQHVATLDGKMGIHILV